MQNPWEMDWDGPAPAQGGGLVAITPRQAEKAKDPLDRARDEQALTNAGLEEEAKRLEIEEKRKKAGGGTKDLDTARYEILNVIDKARDARELSKNGWFTTGFGRETAKSFGLTGPADVEALLNTIGSNTAFSKLMQVKEGGGSLGALSDSEMALLKDSVASLNPNQSDDQFQRQMDKIIEHYGRAFVKAGGDPEILKAKRGDNTGPGGTLSVTVTADSRAGVGDKSPSPAEGPGLIEQFGNAAINNVAGLIQGGGAIFDAGANALGYTMGTAADALGAPDWVGNSLRRPTTINGMVESVAPTPKDWGGWGARTAAQLVGGAASMPQKAVNALTGRIVGTVPEGLPAAVSAFTPRSQLGQDAADLKIPLMPADTGGATTRTLTSAFGSTPGGAAPIRNAAVAVQDAGASALRRIAQGAPVTRELTGEVATRGALAYRESSRKTAGRMYDIANNLAGDAKVIPQRAVEALDNHIAEYGESAVEEGASALVTLRDNLARKIAEGGMTVQGIRLTRTALRDKFYKDGLRGSDIERRAMEVVDGISDDLATSLTEAGKGEAVQAFRAADQAWKARTAMLDGVIMPIIGNSKTGIKSGEQVANTLRQKVEGGGRSVERFLQALPEDDALTVRSSLINGLGRGAKQGEENFSFARFVTNYEAMGPRAKSALFPAESRQAIEKLYRVATNVKAAGQYANFSNTSIGSMGIATAFGGFTAGGMPGVVLAIIGQYGAGRILASPKLATHLAKIASSRNPQEANAGIQQLSVIAKRNPEIANDIAGLQSRLVEALGAAPVTRAAAQENQKVR